MSGVLLKGFEFAVYKLCLFCFDTRVDARRYMGIAFVSNLLI